jgi:hypothetical protein
MIVHFPIIYISHEIFSTLHFRMNLFRLMVLDFFACEQLPFCFSHLSRKSSMPVSTPKTSPPLGVDEFQSNFERLVVSPYEWDKKSPSLEDFGSSVKDLLGALMYANPSQVLGARTILSAIFISLSRRSNDDYKAFARLVHEPQGDELQVEALFGMLDDCSHTRDMRRKLLSCFSPNPSAVECLRICSEHYQNSKNKHQLHVATFILMAQHSMKYAEESLSKKTEEASGGRRNATFLRCVSCLDRGPVIRGTSMLLEKYVTYVASYREKAVDKGGQNKRHQGGGDEMTMSDERPPKMTRVDRVERNKRHQHQGGVCGGGDEMVMSDERSPKRTRVDRGEQNKCHHEQGGGGGGDDVMSEERRPKRKRNITLTSSKRASGSVAVIDERGEEDSLFLQMSTNYKSVECVLENIHGTDKSSQYLLDNLTELVKISTSFDDRVLNANGSGRAAEMVDLRSRIVDVSEAMTKLYDPKDSLRSLRRDWADLRNLHPGIVVKCPPREGSPADVANFLRVALPGVLAVTRHLLKRTKAAEDREARLDDDEREVERSTDAERKAYRFLRSGNDCLFSELYKFSPVRRSGHHPVLESWRKVAANFSNGKDVTDDVLFLIASAAKNQLAGKTEREEARARFFDHFHVIVQEKVTNRFITIEEGNKLLNETFTEIGVDSTLGDQMEVWKQLVSQLEKISTAAEKSAMKGGRRSRSVSSSESDSSSSKRSSRNIGKAKRMLPCSEIISSIGDVGSSTTTVPTTTAPLTAVSPTDGLPTAVSLGSPVVREDSAGVDSSSSYDYSDSDEESKPEEVKQNTEMSVKEVASIAASEPVTELLTNLQSVAVEAVVVKAVTMSTEEQGNDLDVEEPDFS